MTVTKSKTAGGHGGNGDGLLESVMPVSVPAASSEIPTQKRPAAASIGWRMCLWTFGIEDRIAGKDRGRSSIRSYLDSVCQLVCEKKLFFQAACCS